MNTNYDIVKSDKTFKYIHLAYIVLTACITTYMLFENIENWLWISLLVLLFTAVISIRHCGVIKSKKWLFISPFLEMMIVLPLSLYTKSAVSLWLILLINIDVIIDYSSKYSTIYSFIGYIIYIFAYLSKANPPTTVECIILFVVGAIQYTIIMSVGFIAKRFYIQNIKYKELTAKQKVQMFELEQLAVVKERNRMAGEIHDTVGHQLTTALVQLEAATVLIDKDTEQAKRRLGIIKDQIKLGLNELRASIGELKENNFHEFEKVLNDLCRRITDTTSIDIVTKFKDVDSIPVSHRKAIYYMSMEAMTNAIKHGRCSKIFLDIICEKQYISIRIANDGIIPDNVEPGFGLTKMKDRIEKLGGTLKNSIDKRNFAIEAKIPIDMEADNNE